MTPAEKQQADEVAKVIRVMEVVAEGIEAAEDVVASWEQGDLAGAVHDLEEWIASAKLALGQDDES